MYDIYFLVLLYTCTVYIVQVSAGIANIQIYTYNIYRYTYIIYVI